MTSDTPDALPGAKAIALLQGDNHRMVKALQAVRAAMLNGTKEGGPGDYGWSITALNKARPLIREALESKDAYKATPDALDAATIERCAQACEAQAANFLSPEYTTGQPMSSFQERFACNQCAAAIRQLASPSVDAEPQQTNDLAITRATRFTAYSRSDPLAIRLEFQSEADRVVAADEIDMILSEAFAQARKRMTQALADALAARGGNPLRVRAAAIRAVPATQPGRVTEGER